MGTFSPWEPTATLPSAGAAVGSAALRRPERGEGRGHIVAAARLQLVIIIIISSSSSNSSSSSSAADNTVIAAVVINAGCHWRRR